MERDKLEIGQKVLVIPPDTDNEKKSLWGMVVLLLVIALVSRDDVWYWLISLFE